MVDPLDNILQKRQVPPASSNLTERIIEASKQASPPKGYNPVSWLSALLDGLLIPKPAFAMVVFLILGLYLGFMSSDIAADTQEDDLYMIYSTGEFDMGEWL